MNEKEDFKKGDKVEYDYIGKHYNAEVYKVSTYGVHTINTENFFRVFHFKPTHHTQAPVTELKHKQ
jgi:hypothetical protein